MHVVFSHDSTNQSNLLGSHEASTDHHIVPRHWVICHRLCTCYILLDGLLYLIGPLTGLCACLILLHQSSNGISIQHDTINKLWGVFEKLTIHPN